jgi:hypothetical protein
MELYTPERAVMVDESLSEQRKNYMRFKVFMVVKILMMIFSVKLPCGLPPWRQHASLKCWLLRTSSHSDLTQMNIIRKENLGGM